jgi:hypothetical protein
VASVEGPDCDLRYVAVRADENKRRNLSGPSTRRNNEFNRAIRRRHADIISSIFDQLLALGASRALA